MTAWTLVTGGAKRLGAAICLALAQRGHNILVHYNTSLKEAEETVKACHALGIEAQSVQGDFSTSQSTQQFIYRLQSDCPAIKNLVNNVGQYLLKVPSQTSAEEWQALFQVNFHSAVAITQALLPSIKSNRGSIINIGMTGLERANTFCTAYATTKLSLWLYTQSLAKELAPSRIRVNMASPGMLENSIDRPASPEKMPMGRFGTLAEVAHAVAFLLEEKSSYITGQNIEIAGGVGL